MIIRAEMPGTVISVGVTDGDAVTAGQELLVLESMKMEIPILAPEAGFASDLAVSSGDLVSVGQALLSIEIP